MLRYVRQSKSFLESLKGKFIAELELKDLNKNRNQQFYHLVGGWLLAAYVSHLKLLSCEVGVYRQRWMLWTCVLQLFKHRCFITQLEQTRRTAQLAGTAHLQVVTCYTLLTKLVWIVYPYLEAEKCHFVWLHPRDIVHVERCFYR